jgi:hypothetical protein
VIKDVEIPNQRLGDHHEFLDSSFESSLFSLVILDLLC